MPRGGFRPGAGRKKGSTVAAVAERKAKAEKKEKGGTHTRWAIARQQALTRVLETGATPLEIMQQAAAALVKAAEHAPDSPPTPEEINRLQFYAKGAELAASMAPYVHAKVAPKPPEPERSRYQSMTTDEIETRLMALADECGLILERKPNAKPWPPDSWR